MKHSRKQYVKLNNSKWLEEAVDAQWIQCMQERWGRARGAMLTRVLSYADFVESCLAKQQAEQDGGTGTSELLSLETEARIHEVSRGHSFVEVNLK